MLSPPLARRELMVQWALSADAYRVLWGGGTTFVDVPTRGAPTISAPRTAGRPAACAAPTGCAPPLVVRSSSPQRFAFGGEVGRFEADGSWTTELSAGSALPPTVEARGVFAHASEAGLLQRFDSALAPVDATAQLPLSEMNRQLVPSVGAAPGRFAVAWVDTRGPGGQVDSTRVARLDAAGSVLDVTIFDAVEVFPMHVLHVGDRFVVVGIAMAGAGWRTHCARSASRWRETSTARGPHDLAAIRSETMAVSEGSTALLAWNEGGTAHLVRVDAEGLPLATHVDASQRVLGLCRDRDDTVALVASSSEWWVATVEVAGAPSLSRRWRLLSSAPGSEAIVVTHAGRCVAVWAATPSWMGAVMDSDGLFHGPTALTAPPGAPRVSVTRALSSDGSSLLLQGSREDVWMLDSLLRVQSFFPYAPDRSFADELAFRLAGASARLGEHLLVWDMESPTRSVGWMPIRLEARLIGPDRPPGEPCLGAFECWSGHCVDGVCCDRACEGECEACTVRAGASADGRCTVLDATTTCREAVGPCDRAETCDGASAACPADESAPDGTACDDELACNGPERCVAGECRESAALECAPPSSCMTGACAEPAGCVWTAVEGCCTSDGDCDDDDPETIDECHDSTCRWSRAERDAGAEPDRDAGLEPDRDGGAPPRFDGGETRDAGTDAGSARPPSHGGCGCRAQGSRPRATVS
ncbi:MAG: hypothetical protein M5U28_10985 [Sandaracinaceae bacterium]|nr:hypothetical protein [Sandaracinaceae bacterium]